MSKTSVYYPKGVCSQLYEITVSDDGILEDIRIQGGCNGNLKGLRQLMLGRPIAEVAALLEGVQCGNTPETKAILRPGGRPEPRSRTFFL